MPLTLNVMEPFMYSVGVGKSYDSLQTIIVTVPYTALVRLRSARFVSRENRRGRSGVVTLYYEAVVGEERYIVPVKLPWSIYALGLNTIGFEAPVTLSSSEEVAEAKRVYRRSLDEVRRMTFTELLDVLEKGIEARREIVSRLYHSNRRSAVLGFLAHLAQSFKTLLESNRFVIRAVAEKPMLLYERSINILDHIVNALRRLVKSGRHVDILFGEKVEEKLDADETLVIEPRDTIRLDTILATETLEGMTAVAKIVREWSEVPQYYFIMVLI